MPRLNRVWLLDAYYSLADSNSRFGLGMTERQGRQKLKDTFPGVAQYVDIVIDAGDDLSKIPNDILEELAAIVSAEEAKSGDRLLNSAIRDRMQQVQRTEPGTDGQEVSMNELIRSR